MVGLGISNVLYFESKHKKNRWTTGMMESIIVMVLWPIFFGIYVGFSMTELMKQIDDRKRKEEIKNIAEQRRGNAILNNPTKETNNG